MEPSPSPNALYDVFWDPNCLPRDCCRVHDLQTRRPCQQQFQIGTKQPNDRLLRMDFILHTWLQSKWEEVFEYWESNNRWRSFTQCFPRIRSSKAWCTRKCGRIVFRVFYAIRWWRSILRPHPWCPNGTNRQRPSLQSLWRLQRLRFYMVQYKQLHVQLWPMGRFRMLN